MGTPSKKLKKLLNSADEEISTTKNIIKSDSTSLPEPSTVKQIPFEGSGPEDADFNYAHATITSMVEKGKEAIEKMFLVAEETGSARAFEILGQLLKTTSEIAKDLVLLRKSKAELNKFKLPPDGNNDPQPESILKDKPLNVFVGTTTELLRSIKESKDSSNTST